jgi:hypothetical protein
MRTLGRKTIKATASAPKSVKAAGGSKTVKAIPSFEEIARRSYEIYLERGGAGGHEVADWLQAEAELLGK